MKKIFMLLSLLTFAFSLENSTNFKSRDCSEINNSEECYDLGCEWITLYEELDNDIIITEGCMDPSDWDNEDCFDGVEDNCDALTEDMCNSYDDCYWENDTNTCELDGPPECVWDCDGICVF